MITHGDIRLARPADARHIAELSRDAIEHGLPWTWRPGRVLRCLADPSTNVVVARSGPGLAGFGIMKYLEDEAHLLLLAVQASHRRIGAGSALLAWLMTTAEVAGMAEVSLELRAGNADALAFYGHHGFATAGRSPGYYSGVEDAVRMARVLRSRKPAP